MGDEILEGSGVFKGERVGQVDDVVSFVVNLTTGAEDMDR